MRKTRWLLLFSLLGLLVLVGWLQRDWIMARVYLSTLEMQGRVRSLHVERIIETLNLKEGDLVADIGAGTGVLSRPFARAVAPNGKVYAVDVNLHLLEHLRRTSEVQGLGNLIPVEGGSQDPNLPEKVDVIMICDTLHHIADPEAYLALLRGYFRPGGKLAIIDFQDGESPHLSMEATRQQVEGWARSSGYRLLKTEDFIRNNYFAIFEIGE